ncbi:MAG TPA: SIS domain-containing protein [Nitrospirae bacterium]|nr:SIS domain-containing protein [Nitrospirota bacterium]
MKSLRRSITKAVDASIRTKKEFFEKYHDQIIEVSRLIAEAFDDGKKLLLFGNGGSATDASHIAAEFINRFKLERPGLPAIALNTDMAVITSIANDYDYSEVFARQVKSLGQEGDIVIAISTSGTSRNILKAIDVCRKRGLITIGLTGKKGEKMASKCNYPFVVPSADTPRIQECHILLGHIICDMVEEILFALPGR